MYCVSHGYGLILSPLLPVFIVPVQSHNSQPIRKRECISNNGGRLAWNDFVVGYDNVLIRCFLATTIERTGQHYK